MKATITYDVVTPESAEQGDVAESGWWMPGGWKHALNDNGRHNEGVLDEARAGAFDLDLRSALYYAEQLGCLVECQAGDTDLHLHSGPDENQDGSRTSYTLHISELTPLRIRLILSALGIGGAS